jgi:hypothetical protein
MGRFSESDVRNTIEDHFERVGSVGVDSGQLLFSDPCYVLDHESEGWQANIGGRHPNYDDVLNAYKTFSEPFVEPWGNEAALVVGTLNGDGCYPVYVRYVDGRAAQVVIDFEGLIDDRDESIVFGDYDDGSDLEDTDLYDDESGVEYDAEHDPE